MNGSVNKILAGLIVVLLGAATIGSFTAAQRLAVVETKVDSLKESGSDIGKRVTSLERDSWSP